MAHLDSLTPDELAQAIIQAPNDAALLREAARRGWADAVTQGFRAIGHKRADLVRQIVEAREAQRYGWQDEVAALEREAAWVVGVAL